MVPVLVGMVSSRYAGVGWKQWYRFSDPVAKTLGFTGEFRGEEACLSFPPGSRFDARDLETFCIIASGFLGVSVIYR